MSVPNRVGRVYVNQVFAGVISEYRVSAGKPPEYEFVYDESYVDQQGAPIGHHYPLTLQPYRCESLPPFFQNLVSEGWVRVFQAKKSNLDKKDDFGLLLANGQDMIGAISVIPQAEG